MNITMKPGEALAYIEEANLGGVPHRFVEVPQDKTKYSKLLKWEAEMDGPGLTIRLRADGTWLPILNEVRSPGVDTIQGYDHVPVAGYPATKPVST